MTRNAVDADTGGDWGYLIVRTLSAMYPQHVKMVHTNWAWAAEPKWTAENPKPEKYSEREMNHLRQGERWYPFGQGRSSSLTDPLHETDPDCFIQARVEVI